MTTSLNVWLRAVRPFSFTASVTPVLVGAALALSFPGDVAWFTLPVFLICAVIFHAATNLINDYYDYINGVDQEHTFGSSGVLVAHLLSPRQVRYGAYALFGAGFILGLTLVFVRGLPILILGLIGILGGYFYTARPVGYKYVALGDLLVFILMGVLLVVGSYLALTGRYELRVFLVSLPIASLVTAILAANNLRDLLYDSKAGVKTLAGVLGYEGGKWHYYGLTVFAYLSVLVMIVTKTLTVWGLLVLLSLPLAVKNMGEMRRGRADHPQGIAFLDVETAKLHLLFGLLLTAAVVLGVFLS